MLNLALDGTLPTLTLQPYAVMTIQLWGYSTIPEPAGLVPLAAGLVPLRRRR